MKTQQMMYLTVEYMSALRTKAAELGVPFSALNEFLGSLALQKLPPERLRAWADELQRSSAETATPKQTRVLGALRSLTTPEAFRFDVGTVADAADLPPREAYRALCALEGRGEVVGVRGEELDRWGRPSESWWRLADVKGEGRMLMNERLSKRVATVRCPVCGKDTDGVKSPSGALSIALHGKAPTVPGVSEGTCSGSGSPVQAKGEGR